MRKNIFLVLVALFCMSLLMTGCARTKCQSADCSDCAVNGSCTETGSCAFCVAERCGECKTAAATDGKCNAHDLMFYNGKIVKCDGCWHAKTQGGKCPKAMAGKCTTDWKPKTVNTSDASSDTSKATACAACAAAKKSDGQCKSCNVAFNKGKKYKCEGCWTAAKNGGDCAT